MKIELVLLEPTEGDIDPKLFEEDIERIIKSVIREKGHIGDFEFINQKEDKQWLIETTLMQIKPWTFLIGEEGLNTKPLAIPKAHFFRQ